jgi:hypothetical protein
MTTSSHLKLPFILPGQAGKHITHNEALAALDTLTQLAVLDRDLSTPPASPVTGARYIVGATPTGAWTGKANQIATHDGAVWLFHAPEPGWLAFVLDENGLLAWSGTAWLPTLGLDAAAPQLGLNAAADPTHRLVVKSDAVRFSHDDITPGSGDIRLKLDKAGTAQTAALLFETASSARAELGTTGDDKFHLRTSTDGATWHEALVADPATGHLGIGTATPAVRLDVDGAIRPASYTVVTVPAATAGAGQLIYVSDESGGATLAFSDGTDWRRLADRAIIS